MDEVYFSLPIVEFCRRAGIGQTLCRTLIADGRIRAVRAGKRKLLIDVASWHEFMQHQAREGVPEYTKTRRAIEVRQANIAKQHKPKPSVDLKALGML